jgi:hypothetical protein
MDEGINVSCSMCFAVPGELCRTKYVAHGYHDVTPVMCPTHRSRLIDARKLRHLCLIALRSSLVTLLDTPDHASGDYPKG